VKSSQLSTSLGLMPMLYFSVDRKAVYGTSGQQWNIKHTIMAAITTIPSEMPKQNVIILVYPTLQQLHTWNFLTVNSKHLVIFTLVLLYYGHRNIQVKHQTYFVWYPVLNWPWNRVPYYAAYYWYWVFSLMPHSRSKSHHSILSQLNSPTNILCTTIFIKQQNPPSDM
jgi:hypothetical protein